MRTLLLLFRFFLNLPRHLIMATWHGRVWHRDYWQFMFALFIAILMGRLD